MKAICKLLLLVVLSATGLYAQYVPVIEVPNEMEFAGMRLQLTRGARDIIQKDIVSITKNAKYFQAKVDRANLYFPLIDKAFEEENVPKDFKYLAIQESSLIPDAVSKSNAVGYWQFKKESAIEVGLRVDHRIDERMNIVVASRGAARYLKRNNQTFDNWIYSLLSYNLGLTGAKSQIDASNIGAKKMTINENTHWYVIRFLAHKLVYQNAVGLSTSMDSVLVEYIHGANKSIDDILAEHRVEKSAVHEYNKWLKSGVIPDDKIYSVVLAVPITQVDAFTRGAVAMAEPERAPVKHKEKYSSASDIDKQFPALAAHIFVINGVKAVFARTGDNSVRLATKGEISKDEFLRYNEMHSFDDVIPGRLYYLEEKKKKAMVMFHTVQYDETLWDIAQNYGIRIEMIRDKNRMDDHESIDVGRVLWLRTKRPKNKPVEYKKVERPAPKVAPRPQPVQPAPVQVKKEEPLPEVVPERPVVAVEATPFIDPAYEYKYHTVVTGETLFGISRKYQVLTDSILSWNGMSNYSIGVGQNLIIHKTLKKAEPIVHEVMTGDTAYRIARQYGVTVAELQEWNNKADLNLRIGEKILIKKNPPKP
jgi:membrane-bound lytic murein transglycosylase D